VLGGGRMKECTSAHTGLEWAVRWDLDQDLRGKHTGGRNGIQAVCPSGPPQPPRPGASGIAKTPCGGTGPGLKTHRRRAADRSGTAEVKHREDLGRASPGISSGAAAGWLSDRQRSVSTAHRVLMHEIYGVGTLSSLALCEWPRRCRPVSSSRKGSGSWLEITVNSSTAKAAPAGCRGMAGGCCAGCCARPRRTPPAM